MKPPRTHDLTKLFKKIHTINPELIEQIFRGVDLEIIMDRISNTQPNVNILEKNSRAFEAWRYYYENEQTMTHTGFLFDLAMSLHYYFSREYMDLKTDFSR